jgi:hypothetical protein
MKRALLLIVAAAVPFAGCAFSNETGITSPSQVSAATALAGNWKSLSAGTAFDTGECGDFSWDVTTLTDTSVSGSFAATCGSGLHVSGTASGTMTSDTTVSISAAGVVEGTGVPSCPFSLSGVGTLTGGNTLTIPYTGSTCLGPLSGTEVLHK